MPAPKLTKRLSLFAVGYFLVMCALMGLGGFALTHLSSFEPVEFVAVHGLHGNLAYYRLPRMTVAVGVGGESSRIKMDIALEVAAKDVRVIEGYQPRITDHMNQFLSTLTAEQIERPASNPWLRGELLKQANMAGAPVPVMGILFRRLVIM